MQAYNDLKRTCSSSARRSAPTTTAQGQGILPSNSSPVSGNAARSPAQPKGYDVNIRSLEDVFPSIWTLEEGASVLDLCFAKFELAQSRAMASAMSDDPKYQDPQVIDAFREVRSFNTAYSEARSRYFDGTGSRFTAKFIADVTEGELLELASEAVAVLLAQRQIEEYQRDVTNPDVSELLRQLQMLEDVYYRHWAHEEHLRRFLSQGLGDALNTVVLIENSNRRSKAGTETAKIRMRQLKDIFRKIAMAILGGLTLIAPMLIMVLHPGLVTVLLTTSVFVFIISILLAVVMREAEPKDIVSATAAYAAVLVVFVGTGGDYSASDEQAFNATLQGTITNNTIINATLDQVTSNPSSPSSLSNGQLAGVVVACLTGSIVVMVAVVLAWIALATEFPQHISPPVPQSKEFRILLLEQKKQARRMKGEASLAV